MNKGPGRVIQAIELKQNGKCRSCGKNFTTDDQIVSNGKRKKYYHKECAQRLNIVIPLPRLVNKGQNPTSILQEPPQILS
jgi:hypothetical protein